MKALEKHTASLRHRVTQKSSSNSLAIYRYLAIYIVRMSTVASLLEDMQTSFHELEKHFVVNSIETNSVKYRV